MVEISFWRGMKKFSYIVILIVLVGTSWWFGRPGNPPAPVLHIPKAEGSVKGVSDDKMPPTSHWETKAQSAGKGDILLGEATDLGSGVASVEVQLQRVSDAAVWDGTKWQASVGITAPATVTDRKFSYTVPTNLADSQTYVIRCQAIDKAGNAQAKWAELTVKGSNISETTKTD
jgi:hypothetical protein